MSSHAESKLLSLDAAVRLVPSGSLLAVGGMMLYRRPVAFCAALVATARDLTLVAFSAGIETEPLVKAGAVATLRTCYAGLEYFGPSPTIRRAVEEGRLTFIDETEMTLAAGLQAAAMRVPWLPVADALIDTDYIRVRPDIVEVPDPMSGRYLLGLPAIAPEVAVIHVPYADSHGNAVFLSSPSLDLEMAFASRQVILTADRICSTSELTAMGDCDLLSFQVDAVVHMPGGSLPTSCYPHHPYDAEALLEYVELT